MGWMKAIATDVEELLDAVWANEGGTAEVGDVAELMREKGWISPTEAGLAARLVADVMGRTPQDHDDAQDLARVRSLLKERT